MIDDTTAIKVCSICLTPKPCTAFAQASGRYRAKCRACLSAISRAEYAQALASGQTKCCTKCGNDLPIAAYHRQPGGRYGARSICQDCARRDRNAFVAANRETVIERMRARYHADPGKARQRSIAYRLRHPDRTHESNVKRYQRHAEKRRQHAREYRNRDIESARQRERESHARNRAKRNADSLAWRMSNPERMRQIKRAWRQANRDKDIDSQHRRRARIKGAPAIEKIDRRAIIARDNSTCYICNRVLLPKEVTLDHYLPLAAGGPHTAANLRVACKPCNSRKWKHLPADVGL